MGERHRYECVQPELGEELLHIQETGEEPDLPEHLKRHLGVCDHCRLVLAVADRLESELARGGLTISVESAADEAPAPVRRPLRGATLAGLGGGLALAASLALVFLLPPSSNGTLHEWRAGDQAVAIERPVEGEMLHTATPVITWTPVEGASEYRVQIAEVDGPFRWTGTTADPRITVPVEAELPAGSRLRAVVEPVPPDLLPSGELSVTFTRTGALRFVDYRITAAPRGVQALGVAGLASLLAALVGAASGRRARQDPCRSE